MKIKERLEAAGIETREYSGRGMFGKTCLAAVADRQATVFAKIGEKAIKTARTDSMGLDVVVYWPDVPWTE